MKPILENKKMDPLPTHKEKPLFEVPEEYFEQQHKEVMLRISIEMTNKPLINTPSFFVKHWLKAACAILIIGTAALLTYFLFVDTVKNEHFFVEENIEPSVLPITPETHDIQNQKIEIAPARIAKLSEIKTETIKNRAIDFYIEDNSSDNFYETMYELDLSYDY